jgi:hypothetical protein
MLVLGPPTRPTLLFWNLKRRPLDPLVGALAREVGADIVTLAESDAGIDETLAHLNADTQSFYFPDLLAPTRLRVFSRFLPNWIQPIEDGLGFSIRQYAPPIGAAFMMVAVHFPSKLYRTEDDYRLVCGQLARAVEAAEARMGHSRTVIIGDFNMNPFESGLSSAGGLHAVMDRRVAAKEERTVLGSQYKFFYNPMWGRLGDVRGRPAGTHYYDSGQALNFYWNMLDQVLLRPSLLDAFDDDGIKIVTEIAGTSLLDAAGRPDKSKASDHLPVVVQLHQIEEGVA